MSDTSIKNDLLTQIDRMPPELQQRLLDFIKTLSSHGVEDKGLLRFGGAISASDLDVMSKAIEEGCEKVDISEW